MTDVQRVSTEIGLVVARAERRLALLHLRTSFSKGAGAVVVASGAAAALRPLVWPLHDQAPSTAVGRALAMAIFGSAVALVVIVVTSWRSRPSTLHAARRIDDSLGLAEVVASGFAFERQAGAGEMALLAVERARRAVDRVAIDRLLVPAALEGRWGRRFLGASALAASCFAVGAIDRLVIERAIHPITRQEAAAAGELKRAADAAATARPADPEKDKDAKALVDAARKASAAAERGDRKRALDALDEMRRAARALEATDRDQARALRTLRDEVEGGAGRRPGSEAGSKRSGRPSATAGEALGKMAKDLDPAMKDPEALRALVTRLERAESAARAAAESARRRSGEKAERATKDGTESSAWSRAAAALKDAREAATRGDAEAAKRALERAEKEIAALDKAREAAKGEGVARLMDDASDLDRSLHAGLTGGTPMPGAAHGKGSGKDGDERSPGGEGASASKDKGGASDPGGAAGGPGDKDHAPGPEKRRLSVSGNLEARADVREGERAAGVIEGMGRGGDPKAYREIFPSYDTVVEDGLREDVVPAARRPVVRRYFSLIRPGAEPESRK